MNSLPHFAVFMIGVGTRPAILLVHVLEIKKTLLNLTIHLQPSLIGGTANIL